MEGYYTIAQIAKRVQKTPQALYKLIKNNGELGAMIEENTVLVGKGKQYSQKILDWIIEYYNNANVSDEEEETADKARIMLLESEIEHYKERLEEAKKQIEEIKKEKEEILRQNGLALLALQQEKQEKQKLLEAPKEKKSIISILFGRKGKERKEND